MIKVLYAPCNFGDKVFNGVADAFRQAGCELEIFDYFYYYNQEKITTRHIRNAFVEKCRSFQPDLIHLQIQHTTLLDAETITNGRKVCPNAKVVNYTIDVRNYVQPQYFAISKVSDFNLISSTGQLEMFKNHGVHNVKYWQVGYDPELYYPEKIPRTYFDFDISFLGNVNSRENYPGHNERIRTVHMLREAFGPRFGLFGTGWPKNLECFGSVEQNKAVTDVYHRSFSVLSISHYNQLDHYFSDRLLMCLSSGRPTISWYFPGYQSYFTDRCDLIVVDRSEQVIEQVKYLLDNKDYANYIGMNGAAKVLAEHTYLSRINELLDMAGLKN